MTDGPAAQSVEGQRLDQWLCFARLTKSRTLAQALIERGKIRVNRVKVDRPSLSVKVGDTLTISIGPRVRIFTVKGFGKRRGPATEAQTLFEELTPATDRTKSSDVEKAVSSLDPMAGSITAIRPEGAGRPTKRERRATERLKDRFREC